MRLLNNSSKYISSNVLFSFAFSAAFQHVRENIDELEGKNGINETDLLFLKGLMDSPVMKSLVKVSPICNRFQFGAAKATIDALLNNFHGKFKLLVAYGDSGKLNRSSN